MVPVKIKYGGRIMPWNKKDILRQIREACKKELSPAEVRDLERLAREYGATGEEISKAKTRPKEARI